MGAELWEAVCWRRGSIRHLFLKKSQTVDGSDEPVAEGSAEPEPEQQQQQQQQQQQEDGGGEDRESMLVAEAVGSLQLMLRAQVHPHPPFA